jgi:hypothetical protein
VAVTEETDIHRLPNTTIARKKPPSLKGRKHRVQPDEQLQMSIKQKGPQEL